MRQKLLKAGEVDILFRYPTGRTMRLVRQGQIPYIQLPDGEIRINEETIKKLMVEKRGLNG